MPTIYVSVARDHVTWRDVCRDACRMFAVRPTITVGRYDYFWLIVNCSTAICPSLHRRVTVAKYSFGKVRLTSETHEDSLKRFPVLSRTPICLSPHPLLSCHSKLSSENFVSVLSHVTQNIRSVVEYSVSLFLSLQEKNILKNVFAYTKTTTNLQINIG